MSADAFDFATTRWSVVSSARHGSHEALTTLATNYRNPLRAYIVALGYAQDADDLVQEFFASKFLREGFLDSTQHGERGRFRTFLKHCLRNFIIDLKDPKRHRPNPGQSLADLRLQAEDPSTGLPLHELAAREAAADQAWDRAWARALLERARQNLAAECVRAGKTRLMEHFNRVLDEDPDAPSRRAVAEDCGMSEGAVGVAFHRMRERLKVLLLDEIRETIARPEDWKEEQRHLLSIFSVGA
ncbi:MAG: hypothetical protein L0Z50_14435 [Verrucomicrobiales bacterium]|nr:hypothetical protein [Verrucomicrobiales bacterium]